MRRGEGGLVIKSGTRSWYQLLRLLRYRPLLRAGTGWEGIRRSCTSGTVRVLAIRDEVLLPLGGRLRCTSGIRLCCAWAAVVRPGGVR